MGWKGEPGEGGRAFLREVMIGGCLAGLFYKVGGFPRVEVL